MQLMWLASPLGRWRTVSVSAKTLVVLAIVTSVLLVGLGNLIQMVALRLAVQYRPDLVRTLGGVVTESDLKRVNQAYLDRLTELREEQTRAELRAATRLDSIESNHQAKLGELEARRREELDRLEETYRNRLVAMRQDLASTGQQLAELQRLKDSFAKFALPPGAQQAQTNRSQPTGRPPVQERRRTGSGSATGGPLIRADFDPAGVGRFNLTGESLLEDLTVGQGEAAELNQWARQARAEWARQLVWLDTQPTGTPLAGRLSMASRFGMRIDPITKMPARHTGLDFAAPPGTPILAVASGTVLRAGRDGPYGLRVDLDHGNGYITRYAHATRLLVKPGERVERGEPIATVGSTGRSTGPHLHFEIIHRGVLIDPERYLAAAVRLSRSAPELPR